MNIMLNRIEYKLLFLFSLTLTVYSYYTAYRMSFVTVYEPANPVWLSLILFTTSVLLLVAAFGAAFKYYIYLNYKFWCSVVLVEIIASVFASYYDFTAGGYQPHEMVITALLSVAVMCIYLIAPCKYCQDIKRRESGLQSE